MQMIDAIVSRTVTKCISGYNQYAAKAYPPLLQRSQMVRRKPIRLTRITPTLAALAAQLITAPVAALAAEGIPLVVDHGITWMPSSSPRPWPA